MNLLEARDKLAAVLAPIQDSDPYVQNSLVDSIEPPALLLGWGEPWLEPMGLCGQTGRIVVTCVSSRIVPGTGLATLEWLVDFVLGRVKGDQPNWTLETVSGPRIFLIAKTNYLACRIQFTVTLDG
jgi:hypothetical protein